ncbi:hypothetical protein CEXT_416411 [Caerostris extrusa]|uniref:Uncharacterized protein n=1 Tax=Caerostris extrusa TaxID=172846 RepID=A0AAV4Y6T1_CAEEX|nr:hypothetical protein CEXT_416411 [Caerostris extrusa]
MECPNFCHCHIKSGTKHKKGQSFVSHHLLLLDHQAKGYFSSEPLNCCILFSAVHSSSETVISPTDIRAKAAGWATIHTDSTEDKELPWINMGSQ